MAVAAASSSTCSSTMDEWKSALRSRANESQMCNDLLKVISGSHSWSQSNHRRPAFCNHCRDRVPWHAYVCEVCKMRAHKKCVEKIKERCKWTVASSVTIGRFQQPTHDTNHLQFTQPHQWIEGNLPMSSKCFVCDKVCGSVLKLQDLRCIWCQATVHEGCISQLQPGCSLGDCALSIVPPLALDSIGDGLRAKLRIAALGGEYGGGSPLLVLVNLKSGENQGVRLIRKLRRLLNPAQVFDIGSCGPDAPLNFFNDLDSFRVLVCGGDGSVGWVLSACDRLGIHNKCHVGVLPLGTGNDLARVLGWGHAFYDETALPQYLRKLERAHTRMLDRWSVLFRAGPEPEPSQDDVEVSYVKAQVDVVSRQINAILSADEPQEVISAAKALCETIKEFTQRTGETYRILDSWVGDAEDSSISKLCETLLGKLSSLVHSLDAEAARAAANTEKGFEGGESSSSGGEETVGELPSRKVSQAKREFVEHDALIGRANSLKKAVKEMLALAERSVDEQNKMMSDTSAVSTKRERFRKKRSRTTPQHVGSSGITPPGSLSLSTDPRERRSPLPSQGSITGEGAYEGTSTSVPSIVEQVKRSESHDERKTSSASPHSRPQPLKLYSSSNLSTSSAAASPPNSPSRLAVTRNRGRGGAWSETSGVGLSPDRSSASAGISPDDSSGGRTFVAHVKRASLQSPQPARIEENGNGGHLDNMLSSPRIGSVEPPTPAETREPSMIGQQDQRLFKPTSECDLRAQLVEVDDPNMVKQSHSDSSIYEHCTQVDNNSPPRKQRWLKVLASGHKKRNHERASPPNKNPLLTSGLTGGSLIAEILLLNAKVLGVANAASLRTPGDSPHHFLNPGFSEVKVMNNYFGIGLDAKIALEFHNKREELPEKARSRSKLFMWYGMLGGKELVHRTYRHLDQRIELWCDGQRVDLPSLQGIVILNIPSYSGGANFWGTARDDTFSVQSFDDKFLEVVALFGVIHVATSRVPNVVRLQKHRLAQCRSLKIIIKGDEPIPVQVDGEPWLQPPGVLHIEHKNRAQLLVRNPAFEATLKTWEEQKEKTAPSTPTALAEDSSRMSQPAPLLEKAADFVEFVESEMAAISVSTAFLHALEHCSQAIHSANKATTPEQRLAAEEEAESSLEALLDLLEDHFGFAPTPSGHTPTPHSLSVADKGEPSRFIQHSKHNSFSHFTFDKTVDASASNSTAAALAVTERWRNSISVMRMELRREENARREACESKNGSGNRLNEKGRTKSRLANWIKSKFRRKPPASDNVNNWSVDEVVNWLSSQGLSHYASVFRSNDVTGRELLQLEKSDLIELGVAKESHMKRFLLGIGELQRSNAASGGISIQISHGSEGTIRQGQSLSVERPSNEPKSSVSFEEPSASSL